MSELVKLTYLRATLYFSLGTGPVRVIGLQEEIFKHMYCSCHNSRSFCMHFFTFRL